MKLYTLEDKHERIIAISDDKKLMERFYKQNKYSPKDYNIFIYEKKKVVKELLKLYTEEILIELEDDIIVREADAELISLAYQDTKYYINDTIDRLLGLVELNFKKKELKVLHEAIEVLKDNSTKKKAKKLANKKDVAILYYTNREYRNMIYELEMGYRNAMR